MTTMSLWTMSLGLSRDDRPILIAALFILVILVAVTLVAYLSIGTSSSVDLVLVTGEVTVITALAITVLVTLLAAQAAVTIGFVVLRTRVLGQLGHRPITVASILDGLRAAPMKVLGL